MDRKRFSRLSRRSFVGAIVGLAFAAAAGVGLAQITSEPSSVVSAVGTSATPTTSTSNENDFAHESTEAKDDLEFEQDESSSTAAVSATVSAQQATSTGEGAGQEKVEVCHMTGNGSSHTINIARPAVAAHVAHGDTEGACAATTTAAAPTTKKPKHHVQSPTHTTSHGNSSHTKPHGHSSHGSSSHGNSGGHGKGHNK